jgi:hypothetical protein
MDYSTTHAVRNRGTPGRSGSALWHTADARARVCARALCVRCAWIVYDWQYGAWPPQRVPIHPIRHRCSRAQCSRELYAQGVLCSRVGACRSYPRAADHNPRPIARPSARFAARSTAAQSQSNSRLGGKARRPCGPKATSLHTNTVAPALRHRQVRCGAARPAPSERAATQRLIRRLPARRCTSPGPWPQCTTRSGARLWPARNQCLQLL